MTATTPATNPLRQRMIDDMRMRKLADKTPSHYLRAVRQFFFFSGLRLIAPPSKTRGAINCIWWIKAFPPSR